MPTRDKATYAGKCDAIQTFIGRSTKAQYRKKQLFLSDMSDLSAMTSEGGNVQEATLSVMSRAHAREIGTSDLIVDEWTAGVYFIAGENQIADSTAASCSQDRFMGRRGLRQTMLAIAVIYGSKLYKKLTPRGSLFQLLF